MQPNLPPSLQLRAQPANLTKTAQQRHGRHRHRPNLVFLCHQRRRGGGGLSRGGGGGGSKKHAPESNQGGAAGLSELASKCSHFGGEETPNTAVPDPDPDPTTQTNRLMDLWMAVVGQKRICTT